MQRLLPFRILRSLQVFLLGSIVASGIFLLSTGSVSAEFSCDWDTVIWCDDVISGRGPIPANGHGTNLTSCVNPGNPDYCIWAPDEYASWECDTNFHQEGSSCVPDAYCGDGNTNAGEDCDDGNSNNNDECTNSCDFGSRTASCGSLPANAEWNTVSEITQTWNGSDWDPETNLVYNTTGSTTKCRYVCAGGFDWDGANCVSGGGSSSSGGGGENGVCGSANGHTFAYSDSGWGSYTQCTVGNPNNTTFPSAGGSPVTWRCSGVNGGSNSPQCSASRAAAPNACGSNAQSYQESVFTWPSTTGTAFCAVGAAPSPIPTFPNQGGSTSWTCNGTTTCTATRAIGCAVVANAIGNPISGPAGTSVSFTGTVTPSGNCTGLPWSRWNYADPGGWEDLGLFSTTHTYNEAGTFLARFIAGYGSNYEMVILPSISISDVCSLSVNAFVDPGTGVAGITNFGFSANVIPSEGCTGTGTYSWDFGDGFLANDQDASHIYMAQGSYTATFTAAHSGEIASTTVDVIVSENKPPRFNLAVSPATGTERTRTWNVSAVIDPESQPLYYTYYAWYNSSTDYQIIADPILSGVPSQNGNLLDYNNDGLITNADFTTVFSGSSFSCVSGKVCDLDGNSVVNATDRTLYQQYMLRSSITFPKNNVPYTYAGPGTYNAQATLYDGMNAVSKTAPVTVGAITSCLLDATITATPTSGPAPLRVRFRGDAVISGTCTDYGSPEYSWNSGNGTNQNGQEVEFSYTNPRSYLADLTVTLPNLQGGADLTVNKTKEIVATAGGGTGPLLNVSGAPVVWVNSDQLATATCDPNGGVPCISTSLRLKVYPNTPPPTGCPTDYSEYYE